MGCPLIVFFIVSSYINNVFALQGVFNLTMKSEILSKLKSQTPHRMLTAGYDASMDFHLGGSDGIYYAEIPIGTPPRNLVFLIDTGSCISWVNCQGCDGCATDDDKKGIHLKPFNPADSTTAEIVKPGDRFCKKLDQPCIFNISYVDGTVLSGYYVRDYLTYNKVTGDHNTEPAKANFTFGCMTKQTSNTSGNYMARGIDGLLGLGTFTGAIFGQMNHSNTARNVFSICLDKNKGGGIFAVGKLVKPTVPMIKYLDKQFGYYNLNIQSMMFGEVKVELNRMAMATLDTGSMAASIPTSVQVVVADLIASKFSVVPETYYAFHCFKFPENVGAEVFEEMLPTWTFWFSDTMSLSVSPRNYMTRLDGFDGWCIQTNKQDFDDSTFILGVPFLSDKLIVYDNENESIGIMDYDCTSSVEVEGGDTNEVFEVDSHSVEPHF